MNTQAVQDKFDKYYESATPEQVVKEFEDLGVEFIELPVTEIVNNKLRFYNLQRKGSSSPCVEFDKAEAALYYIELHKFLTDELNRTITSISQVERV